MTDLVKHLREFATDLCCPTGCCYGESMVKAADEIEYLRTLLSNAVREYPVASGLYVDGDGQAGYGSLKAMRLHLKMASTCGFLHRAPITPAERLGIEKTSEGQS